jgi:histidinol dehydrogenase
MRPERIRAVAPYLCVDPGRIFVGPYSAVALGDYSSDLNHTLPTNRSDRYTGGLSVLDFLKVQTTLRVEKTGIESIGPMAQHLAELEELAAHARSVEIRLNP